MVIFSLIDPPFVNKSISHPLLEPHEIPIIRVDCEASQALGIKHSVLIDATQPMDIIQEKISDMLSKSSIPWAKKFNIYGVQKLAVDQRSVQCAHDAALEVLERILNRKAVREKLIVHYGGNRDLVDEVLSYYQRVHESELAFATEHFNKPYTEDCCPPCCYDFRMFAEYLNYEQYRQKLFPKRYFSIEARGKLHILGQPRPIT